MSGELISREGVVFPEFGGEPPASGLLGRVQVGFTRYAWLKGGEPNADESEALVHEAIHGYYKDELESLDESMSATVNRVRNEERKARRRHTRALRRALFETDGAIGSAVALNRRFEPALRRYVGDKPEHEGIEQLSVLEGIESAVGGIVLWALLQASLHARVIRTLREVRCLLRNGMLEGALARCRTLLESLVTQLAIGAASDEPYEVAERYQAWIYFEDSDLLTPEIEARIRDKWGKQFFTPLGWALPLRAESRRERMTFAKLCELVSAGSLFKEYRYFSHFVHIGPMHTVAGADLRSEYIFETRHTSKPTDAAPILRFANMVLGLSTECLARDVFRGLEDFDSLGWASPVFTRTEAAIEICRLIEKAA